jgi:hypothetical protein
MSVDGDDQQSASSTSTGSMDLCDMEESIRAAAATCSTSSPSAPCQMVHFQIEPEEGHYIPPLEKLGKNYRSLRRRGAAVHSLLLKSCFDASMSSYEYETDYDDDDEEKQDDYSMYASNSTLASRDDDIMTVPRDSRKRIRNDYNNHDIGHLFGDMGLRNDSNHSDHSPLSQHSKANRARGSPSSTEGSLQLQHVVVNPQFHHHHHNFHQNHHEDHQSVESSCG